MNKAFSFSVLLIVVVSAVWIAALVFTFTNTSSFAEPAQQIVPSVSPSDTAPFLPESAEPMLPASLVLAEGVPFTAQAPSRQWNDPRFAEGCEEASAIIAMAWVRGETVLTPAGVEEEIAALTAWQHDEFGGYRDTSASATADRIFRAYFKHSGVRVKYDVAADDIKQELIAGNLLVVPMNGQALANPYYRSPGPDRHMLVVIGYDPDSDEFITHDPGTRRGASYRYPADTFVAAIRDYPSGEHIPIVEQRSAMIIVQKD